MELSPSQLSQSERYKLLIGAILPRPIAFVSTISPAGQHNIAPFSFFSGVGSDPMMLLFCPANKPDGSEKDSLINASPTSQGGTGAFVVNVVPAAIVGAMALAAEPLAYGESEFDLTGLTPAPATVVCAPRLAQSPISFECLTRQVIRTNPGKSAGGNIVIGEVVHIHINDAVVTDRLHLDPAALDLVGRMGGLTYCHTRDRFELKSGRP
jgi:flavin reductase (DIM6/NTAB) family NADH-FMN oxidoreductase RutF